MDNNSAVSRYFLDVLYREYFYLKNHEKPKKSWLRDFFSKRMLELYWSITRFIGLGFLHDGRRQATNRLDQILRQRPSVPGSSCIQSSDCGRILIDVASTHLSGKETGIQRVVKEIAFAGAEMGAALPVLRIKDRFYPYFKNAISSDTVELAPGDTLLLLDAPAADLESYSAAMKAVKSLGGQNVVCIYDLLPKTIPWSFSPEQLQHYEGWFRAIVCESDAAVCISESVAHELKAHLTGLPQPVRMPVGWFQLGGNFRYSKTLPVGADVTAITQTSSPIFLSVGTLEPRKGYHVSLDAMESLWKQGIDAHFVIVGRYGWMSEVLQRRILEHEEHRKRLHWLQNANDAELHYLYSSAHALVFASLAEGFGLPIIEAANDGLPVIASDIPIFREVGGENISYFRALDSSDLARKLLEAVTKERQPKKIEVPDWSQSTQKLLDMIRTQSYQLK
ncbi:glycosyltransferase family 4 protein [Methylocystis sp.]|uniref:glycosyltransferase family 4 protein n=1 Tax=Methylocystis sp. TaxID=1911079 RepID=UPI003DA692CF